MCAIKPPTGNTTSVAATCETKAVIVRIPRALCRNGITPSKNKVAAVVINPSKYQRRALSVRSATGPQRNRQRLADNPMATTDAAVATENPARVRINGSVIETKPLLMPYGRTRKKKVPGLVELGSRMLMNKITETLFEPFPYDYGVIRF